MAKKVLKTVLTVTTVVAAAGAVCYIFRDKIKESLLFQKGVNWLSGILNKDDDLDTDFEEDDFFFDDELDESNLFAKPSSDNRDYTSITITSSEEEEEPIPEEPEETATEEDESKEEETEEAAPKKEEATAEDTKEDETPVISIVGNNIAGSTDSNVETYENEGLSDVYEDPDSLEDQDKLDY